MSLAYADLNNLYFLIFLFVINALFSGNIILASRHHNRFFLKNI